MLATSPVIAGSTAKDLGEKVSSQSRTRPEEESGVPRRVGEVSDVPKVNDEPVVYCEAGDCGMSPIEEQEYRNEIKVDPPVVPAKIRVVG